MVSVLMSVFCAATASVDSLDVEKDTKIYDTMEEQHYKDWPNDHGVSISLC